MGRFWSLFFLLIPILGVATFIVGPMVGIDLPEDVSQAGYKIDHLYNFILWLTGIVFIGTEVTLFWFMWRYDGQRNKDPVKFSHGNHHLEVIWTLIPAGILVFIAVYQVNVWADNKIETPNVAPTVEVTARQFEWRLRYPGKDGRLGTRDDVHHVNNLHVPVDTDVLIELKSMDVLHSFFLPNLRVKQDAVPGMKIPVWFRATKTGTYDVVCAELCGWGHYKMKGRLTVQSPEDYERWLESLTAEQEAIE